MRLNFNYKHNSYEMIRHFSKAHETKIRFTNAISFGHWQSDSALYVHNSIMLRLFALGFIICKQSAVCA